MRFINSITGKFRVTTVIFLFLYTVVFIIIISTTQKDFCRENLIREAYSYINVMESSVVAYLDENDSQVLTEHLGFIKTNPLIKYAYVLDRNGIVLSDGTTENSLPENSLDDEFTMETINSTSLLVQELEMLIDLSMPVKMGNETIGFIKMGFSKERMNSQMSELQMQIFIIGIVMALFGSLITLFFARHYSKPLQEYTGKMKKITEGSLDQKVSVSSNKELRSLSESFNEMTRKLAETQDSLIKAKEEAEQASRLKTEFLAQMSHEIRSPINTILSFTSLMKDDLESILPEEYRDFFSSISNAGGRITRTIDMILDLSEIQTGTYETKMMIFDLVEEVLKAMVVEYKNPASKKGLTIDLVNNSKHSLIYADQYMVSQVFQNLIDNAIKYSQKGSVTVKVSDGIENELIVEVVDTGIGIGEEFVGNLFEPFRQEEQGYSRRYDGSGLGLALVKRYCELNNSSISVQSKKGEGSVFRVVFQKYSVTSSIE